eukprot:7382741-Prymnesium_polylepis.1
MVRDSKLEGRALGSVGFIVISLPPPRGRCPRLGVGLESGHGRQTKAVRGIHQEAPARQQQPSSDGRAHCARTWTGLGPVGGSAAHCPGE